eukprot:311185-Prymnesium_polylepis.1
MIPVSVPRGAAAAVHPARFTAAAGGHPARDPGPNPARAARQGRLEEAACVPRRRPAHHCSQQSSANKRRAKATPEVKLTRGWPNPRATSRSATDCDCRPINKSNVLEAAYACIDRATCTLCGTEPSVRLASKESSAT